MHRFLTERQTALLLNLMPGRVDEARALIPGLDDVSDDVLSSLLRDAQDMYKETSEDV